MIPGPPARFVILMAATCLAGCATSPDSQVERVDVPLPEAFTADAHGVPLSATGWLADFEDPQLSSLVAESQARNYDLKIVAARMKGARAAVWVDASGRLPQLSAEASARRSQRTSSSGFQVSSTRNNRFDLGASLIWEVDLWGRFWNRHRAAVADREAAEADYRGARLSLAANTAKAWFNTIETAQQLQLAHETLTSFQNNLVIVENGYRRGVSSALDVRLSRANVASARSNLEGRRRDRDAAVRALEVLLGHYPAKQLQLVRDFPELRRPVPAGLPSDLLSRRPDLVAAERRLAASGQRVQESRKALLPSISLTASGGTSSTQLKDILSPDQIIWNIGGNLAQPLFQGGRLWGNLQLSEAVSEEALAGFAQTLLLAFQEVETALAAEGYLADQLEALEVAATESRLAEDLAWQEYQRGITDIITVLESQRRAFNAQSSLLEIRNLRLQNRLDLYLALGGDFDTVSETRRPMAETARLSP